LADFAQQQPAFRLGGSKAFFVPLLDAASRPFGKRRQPDEPGYTAPSHAAKPGQGNAKDGDDRDGPLSGWWSLRVDREHRLVCRASDDSFADRDAATITDGIRDSRDTRMIVTKRLRSNGFAAVGHVSKTKAGLRRRTATAFVV
jgi:hypothetical protein